MTTIELLLILAIIIPVLALFGHLWVAYKFAPQKAKEGVMDALVKDQEFQTDLIKTLLNNMFREIKDGENTVIPVDAIINRAIPKFKEWMTKGLPKELPAQFQQVMQYDADGNIDQDAAREAMIMANMPKSVKQWYPLIKMFLQRP